VGTNWGSPDFGQLQDCILNQFAKFSNSYFISLCHFWGKKIPPFQQESRWGRPTSFGPTMAKQQDSLG